MTRYRSDIADISDIGATLVPTVVEQTREILKARDTINQIYARHTGQPADTIKRDTERDNFMSADEAREYGLVDQVLTAAVRR